MENELRWRRHRWTIGSNIGRAGARLQRLGLPHTRLPFSIFSLLTHACIYMRACICVLNARGKNVRANNEERWWGASQAFASPLCHRTPLNYSVSLKYWYGNHSWLNWRRTAGKKKKRKRGQPRSTVLLLLSFFFIASSTIRLMAFDGRQLLILISRPFRTGCATTLRNDYQGSESLIRRGIKTPPALWALDREARCFPRPESKITAVKVLMIYKLIQQPRYQLTMRLCDNICVCTAVKLETVAPCLRKTCWEMFK